MGWKNVLFGLSNIVSAVTAISALEQSSVFDINSSNIAPIEIVGKKFFNSKTGEQFFLKGVAYQPTIVSEGWNSKILNSGDKFIDPLAEPSICLRDLSYFEKLNVNTLRVYSIDTEKNHDVCMDALANSGIYVLIDLPEPDYSIDRNQPSWDISIFERYTSVVDVMQKYPNVLGFFGGNEVTNDETNTDASPFVKAAIRDIKHYIRVKNYRQIPVGYSSNDDAATRDSLAQYFACGGEAAADFYGINMYEWCGYSSYEVSGYRERTLEFADYPMPVFFSEFGCNTIRPRPFTEVSALFGRKMSQVWSGGLVYMYFEEENEYGLTKIDENGSVHELEDFKYLQNAYRKASPHGTTKEKYLQDASSAISAQMSECPNDVSAANTHETWKASVELPPSPNAEICKCLEQVLPCLVSPFTSSWNYQDHFDYACSQVDCRDITTDGETGVYGEFSYCIPEQKLALEISKMYHTKNHPTGFCPMSSKNVFYNEKSMNITDPMCVEVFQRLQESRNTVDSKKTPSLKKLIKPKLKNANYTKPSLDADSGSSLRSKHSGYAILLISIIFATMVF
ncbi:hypothetical protein ZYGR_0AF04400 [Zygosaccharomyces rouxii]|uniref:1,3-beta-glucanosyltransferase n=1 Tax=Zygosaccharomyces rouxii TaxID=4956 RepID=A0A1Q3A8H2_ZYGRO|nr:hypothetical protein ZYGR_0AF04400 [Zygosaccharomyces rouxii]